MDQFDNKMITRIVICFLLFCTDIVNSELVFIQALWRHGDRAPLKFPYPKDRYNESFWPRGWAELTNIGMRQHHELGTWFKQQYKGFLPTNFSPHEIYIRSSDSDRALTSAQAMLSGLFPAVGVDVWENGNSWKPIAVHAASPGELDMLCKPGSLNCPVYDKEVDGEKAADAQMYDTKYSDLMKTLADGTGIANFGYLNSTAVFDINRELIHNMTTQPSWVFQSWPQYNNRNSLDIMSELHTKKFLKPFETQEKSKYHGGYLLSNWIDNALQVANGTMGTMKFKGFSSHDTTQAALFGVLGLSLDIPPPYASAIIMEVHKTNNNYFAKLFYRNSTTVIPAELSFPNCINPCPVSSLPTIYQKVLVPTYQDVNQICATQTNSCHSGVVWSTLLLSITYFIL